MKLALTSLTSGGRSVGIVRWRTKAPKFYFFIYADEVAISVCGISELQLRLKNTYHRFDIRD
jgi:hypothetical protein